MLRGPYRAAVELAASVCAMPRLSDRAAAHSLFAHAGALAASGQAELARALYDRACYTRVPPPTALRSACDVRLGDLCFAQGRMDEAQAHHEATIGMAKALGDRRLECSAANGLGTVQFAEGRNAARRCSTTRARSSWRARPDTEDAGRCAQQPGQPPCRARAHG